MCNDKEATVYDMVTKFMERVAEKEDATPEELAAFAEIASAFFKAVG